MNKAVDFIINNWGVISMAAGVLFARFIEKSKIYQKHKDQILEFEAEIKKLKDAACKGK